MRTIKSENITQYIYTYIWARFLSLTQSKLRLCSANNRAAYLSTVWAYSEQETENRPCLTRLSGLQNVFHFFAKREFLIKI